MNNEEIRLECLKLATKEISLPQSIDLARKYYEFVIENADKIDSALSAN